MDSTWADTDDTSHPDVEWRFKREIGKNWILFEEYKDDFEEHYQYYNHDLGADRRIGR